MIGILLLSCVPLSSNESVLLWFRRPDPALAEIATKTEPILRAAAQGRFQLRPHADTLMALTVESGAEQRQAAIAEARALLLRAEERFRELEDEEALELVARATTVLVPAQGEPEALHLSAQAHVLGATAFLARDRIDAARQRLGRAWDLDPDLEAKVRSSPRVAAELAAVRALAEARPVGRLEVQATSQGNALDANVFLDGRHLGLTPLNDDAVPDGRHLLRIRAPGHLSHMGTVEIIAGQTTQLNVALTPDPEIVALRKLEPELAPELLALLAARGQASRVLVAELRLGPQRNAYGLAEPVLWLWLPNGPMTLAPLSPKALGDAFDRLSRCESLEPQGPQAYAPALALTPAALSPAQPTHWWRSAWLWGLIATVAVASGVALVSAQASNGPPEAARVTLIPRP